MPDPNTGHKTTGCLEWLPHGTITETLHLENINLRGPGRLKPEVGRTKIQKTDRSQMFLPFGRPSPWNTPTPWGRHTGT